MKCFNCNAMIPENAEFCPRCGKALAITPALLNAALKKDQSALTELYNRTYNPVYNTIKFLIRDEDTVLDILQDSYIKAFNSLDQLQNANKFEPWVKRIAHNKAIDYLRVAKPVSFSSLESDDSGRPVDFEDDRPDHLPEVVIDRNETTRLINEILDSLPDDQRACISLFYYDQLSVKEIADELGVSEATVKSRLNYGRKKIETQVRALEKKGTKLYGLAPLPFLMLLFHQEVQAAEAPVVILQGILGQTASQAVSAGMAAQTVTAQTAASSAKTAAIAAKATGTASKAVIGQAAAHTAKAVIAPKVIAIIAAAAVAVGGGAAAVHHVQQTKQETAVVSEVSEEEETESQAAIVSSLPEKPELPEIPEEPPIVPPTEEVTENEPEPAADLPALPADPLDAILDRYISLLAEDPQKFLSSAPSGLLNDIDYDLIAEHFRSGSPIYGGYVDYNDDGRMELVLALGNGNGSDKEAKAIYFTDGEELSYVCITDELGNRANLYALTDGQIMLHAGSSETSGTDIIFKLTGSDTGLGLFLDYEYDLQKYGNSDHYCGSVSLSDEEFYARYWDGSIEAAHFGDIAFFDLTSGERPVQETPSSAQASSNASAPAQAPVTEATWKNAYQAILNGYQQCMSEGLGGSSPYLQYEKVRFTLEARDGSRAIQYALYDVNNDSVPELIFALNEYVAPGTEWWTPFEVYTMNGTAAVPLFQNVLMDYETLHIGADGTLWIDSGNSGTSPKTFYKLPAASHAVTETSPAGGLPDDAALTYQSILKTVY